MSKKDNKCCKKTSIGGQALMEGIMMRGPEVTAMAVRNTQGEIVLEKMPTQTKKRAKIWTLPIIRGVFNYIDSMVLGTKCLMRSAEISGLEEAEEELRREKEAKKSAKAAKKAAQNGETVVKAEEKAEEVTKTVTEAPEAIVAEASAEETTDNTVDKNSVKADETKPEKKKDDSSLMTTLVMVIGVVFGILMSIGLFLILPSFIYGGIAYLIPAIKHNDPAVNSLIQSVIEGVLKLIIIVGYMALMILMKDIRRTFQFHGAEHKTIFCYEAGLELTVENVRGQRRFHPRCGTSFLILMILVSIFVSFFINPLYHIIFGSQPTIIVRVLIKLLILPLIVGVGYELIKLAGRHDNIITRIISAPGVWLQHITVLEPDDSMIECAIAAMKEVIPENGSDNY